MPQEHLYGYFAFMIVAIAIRFFAKKLFQSTKQSIKKLKSGADYGSVEDSLWKALPIGSVNEEHHPPTPDKFEAKRIFEATNEALAPFGNIGGQAAWKLPVQTVARFEPDGENTQLVDAPSVPDFLKKPSS